jgi:hypothetical protein
VVVGDPTLERILVSTENRTRYRDALGTGARKLIVMASTWGPESLFERRRTLPAELATRLPHDAYQVALILHPNARSTVDGLNLTERLRPASDAGLFLAEPYEEWAALLVAADAVITDHGSTALYAAALDRPLISACDGGDELIAGSPMAELLARIPRLDVVGDLPAAFSEHVPGSGLLMAESVFAERGRALRRLREEMYELLDLAPPDAPVNARVLPSPSSPVSEPSAFAVRTRIDGSQVRVERFPSHGDTPAHHLAAEYGVAGVRHDESAGLLYRRTASSAPTAYSLAWTADAWTANVLENYPGCRTAAVIMTPSLCLARTRNGPLLAVHIDPWRDNGRVVRTDPAAILSAVHAWLAAYPQPPAAITCLVGEHAFPVRLTLATPEDASRAC